MQIVLHHRNVQARFVDDAVLQEFDECLALRRLLAEASRETERKGDERGKDGRAPR